MKEKSGPSALQNFDHDERRCKSCVFTFWPQRFVESVLPHRSVKGCDHGNPSCIIDLLGKV